MAETYGQEKWQLSKVVLAIGRGVSFVDLVFGLMGEKRGRRKSLLRRRGSRSSRRARQGKAQ
jgi:hypothetical protein